MSVGNKKVIIVLPVVGKPYIAGDKDATNFKHLQEIVGGGERMPFERVHTDYVFIHPLFKIEQPRWNAIDVLRNKLRKNQYEIFCNENGIMSECPNMATIYKSPIFNDVRPLFGIVAILTKEKHTQGLGLPIKDFMEEEPSSDEEESSEEEEH